MSLCFLDFDTQITRNGTGECEAEAVWDALDTRFRDLKVYLKAPEDRLLHAVSSTTDNASAATSVSTILAKKKHRIFDDLVQLYGMLLLIVLCFDCSELNLCNQYVLTPHQSPPSGFCRTRSSPVGRGGTRATPTHMQQPHSQPCRRSVVGKLENSNLYRREKAKCCSFDLRHVETAEIT